MLDAVTAAKAIQDRHGTEASTADSLSGDHTPRMLGYCAYCTEDTPCPDRADAGVVLARLNNGTVRALRIEAALACLRSEDS